MKVEKERGEERKVTSLTSSSVLALLYNIRTSSGGGRI